MHKYGTILTEGIDLYELDARGVPSRNHCAQHVVFIGFAKLFKILKKRTGGPLFSFVSRERPMNALSNSRRVCVPWGYGLSYTEPSWAKFSNLI